MDFRLDTYLVLKDQPRYSLKKNANIIQYDGNIIIG